MITETRQPKRRKDSLSRELVIATAVDILDTAGEGALTFRALGSRLSTGSGAIYWYVADKDALLSSATEQVLSEAMAGVAGQPDPADALVAIALGVFDAIEAHPWVGTELARQPWQPAMGAIFERSSAEFHALGVPSESLFHCVSALAQYLLGSAAQTAAAARHKFEAADRAAVLDTIVKGWTERDPGRYPFIHLLADQMRTHDERESFLVGFRLLLAGAKALVPSEPQDGRKAVLKKPI